MPSPPTPRQTKYAVLAGTIREQIQRGLLLPGDRLPSLGELCQHYEAAMGTVDRALAILEKDALIVRVNGSGIFVAEPPARPSAKTEKPRIGLVIPFCHGEFFSPIVDAVQRESRAAGYTLIVANSLNEEPIEVQVLEELADQVDGLCVLPVGPGNQSAFASLLEKKTPFVLLDQNVEGLKVNLVTSDNERGGYLATKHLLEAGCHRVYTIGESSAHISTLKDRIAGFRRALSEAGLRFEPSLIRQSEGDMTRLGYFLTRELLLELGIRCDGEKIGLFALNEHISPGCYLAIKERRLRIPEDVAIVGFDDNTANIFEPPLTAIRQDLSGMGREGVRRLVELLRVGANVKPRTIRLPAGLIVRNSSDSESDFCSLRLMHEDPQMTPTRALAGI